MKLRIHFEDRLQDLLWLDVSESGQVVDCNGSVGRFQRGLLIGMRVIEVEMRSGYTKFVLSSADLSEPHKHGHSTAPIYKVEVLAS